MRRPEEAWDPVVPACHRVSPADESGLMRRLLESGMVVLVEESKLPQDSHGSFLPGGLFCVGKNSEEDRLILDPKMVLSIGLFGHVYQVALVLHECF